MIMYDGRKIIPIGCSCMTQFQADAAFANTTARSFAGLLDWNIASPTATVAILEGHLSGRLIADFTRRDHFTRHPKGGHLVHQGLSGFHFWHEDAETILTDSGAFDRFCAKMRHVIAQTFADEGEVHLIWSNLQPNLKASVVGKTTDRWSTFRLTTEWHARIINAAQAVFAAPHIHFVSRAQDCDTDLHDAANLWLLPLDRGWGFRGPKGLYAPLFDHILRTRTGSAAVDAAGTRQTGDNLGRRFT